MNNHFKPRKRILILGLGFAMSCAQDDPKNRSTYKNSTHEASNAEGETQSPQRMEPTQSSNKSAEATEVQSKYQATDNAEAASRPQNITGSFLTCQPVEQIQESGEERVVMCDFKDKSDQSVHKTLPDHWLFTADANKGAGVLFSYQNIPDDPWPHQITVSGSDPDETNQFLEQGGIQWVRFEEGNRYQEPVMVQVIVINNGQIISGSMENNNSQQANVTNINGHIESNQFNQVSDQHNNFKAINESE